MADLDPTRLCVHGYAPSECVLCGPPPPRDETAPPVLDPQMWVAAYVASRRELPEVPVELVGVPLS